MHGVRGSTATWTVGLLLVFAAGVPPVSAAEQAPVRILAVGDSLTISIAGDYSWRYFAARALDESGVDVDFVGPRTAPHDSWVTLTWPAVYADPAFDQDHAGAWGDSYTQPKHDRAAVVAEFAPDVVVVQLGTNDLNGFWRSPSEILGLAHDWVSATQAQSPGTDVVLTELTWTTNPDALAYNELLRATAPGWSTASWQVVVARAADGFVTSTAEQQDGFTWDPVHLNTPGQVHVAAAVVDALAELGVGSAYPRGRPLPPEGPHGQPVVRSTPGLSSASLSWSAPPGATNYDLWRRTAGGTWHRLLEQWHGTQATIGGLTECRREEFRVLARKGWTRAPDAMASTPLVVRAGRRVTGSPALSGVARGRSVRQRWSSVPGACEYRVRSVQSLGGVTRVRSMLTSGTSRRLSVRPGTVLRVRVSAVGGWNTGPVSAMLTLRVRKTR